MIRGDKMYNDVVENLSASATKKIGLFDKSKFKYIIGSAIAGFYIGVGILIMALSMSIFSRYENGVVSLVNGFVFSCALSFVMITGGELFTGNILVMSQGAMSGSISHKKAVSACALSWIGNLLGALVLSFLFYKTHLTNISESIVALGIKKASADFIPLVFKGIFCNILVCVAVVSCYRVKSESAKLIMIFWCILPFVALGFEHSVANMTVFILGRLYSTEITLAMAIHNLIPVTIGNVIGGLIVSIPYRILGK